MRGRMKRFRLDSKEDRSNPRALRVAFGITAVGAALLLAACSSSSSTTPSTTPSTSSSSSSSVASSTAPASSAATTSGVDLSALNADITKAAATPSFSDYGPQYGGKV